jgi:MYXO-CTERM domain-containing protein
MISASSSRAGTVYNLSTGFDNATQALLAPNTTDPKYTVVGPDSKNYVPQARAASNLPSSYVPDNAIPGSRWDYLVDTASDTSNFFAPVGNYTATTTFSMSGFKASTAKISGLQTSVDNALLSVVVNGTTVFSQSQDTGLNFGLQSVQDIGDLGLGDFHDGLNTVQFIFFNQGFVGGPSPSPAAFRVGATIDAEALQAVPEPSGIALAAMGLVYLVGRRRRAIVRPFLRPAK